MPPPSPPHQKKPQKKKKKKRKKEKGKKKEVSISCLDWKNTWGKYMIKINSPMHSSLRLYQ